MPSNKRVGASVSQITNSEDAYGAKLDPGPYIGIIKNNTDPARQGRVQVWISDFGGKENEQTSWVTVSYASPYMGSTRWPRETKEKSELNQYDKVNHSYGMWMTPPDIGNFVLVTFICGDPNRGYYFASIFQEHTHHAVPAIGGTNYLTETFIDPALSKALDCAPYPSVEFNEVNKGLHAKWNNFLQIPKPPHEEQNLRLLKEGLEDDKSRGVVSSTSQRESPSRVFGISTPGRPSPKDMPIKELNNVKGPEYRLGGHTFVMDDGDTKGENRIVRLRTARGHQIIMSDHEKPEKDFIYVGNAEGTAWFEMTAQGEIQFYAENSISFRTKKDFNMYVENEMNVQTKKHFNLFADGSIVMEADQITGLAKTELHMHSNNVAGFKADKHLYFQSGETTHLNVGKELIVSATGDITVKTSKNLGTQSVADTTILSGAKLLATSTNNMELKSGGVFNAQSANNMNLKSSDSFLATASNNVDIKAGGNMASQAGGEVGVKASNDVKLTGSNVQINGATAPDAGSADGSASASSVGEAKKHGQPAMIHHIKHREVETTMAPPYYKWKPKTVFVSTVPIIPKHEPSNSRGLCCGVKSNDTGGVHGGPVYVLLDQEPKTPDVQPDPEIGKAPWNSTTFAG